MDISHNSGYLDCALVRLDGEEGRIYKQLTEFLGTSERAQNALILVGAMSKLGTTDKRVRKIKDSFLEMIGVSYDDFSRFLETL